MVLAVGPLAQVSVGSRIAQLSCTAASGGTGPYSYQLYVDTSTGFSPGAGNLVSGATSLINNVPNLDPNVTYYAKMVVTDTGNSNATATSSQLTFQTAVDSQLQNQFKQTTMGGFVAMPALNTKSMLIASTQATAVLAGQPVKRVSTQTDQGIPQVVSIASDADLITGFVNFMTIKSSNVAGDVVEVSQNGNIMSLFSGASIAPDQLVVWSTVDGGVLPIGSTGKRIVGRAVDGCSGRGSLVRVAISAPDGAVDA